MGFLVLILLPLNDFMKFELPSVGTYFTNDASAEPRNSLFLSWEVGAGGSFSSSSMIISMISSSPVRKD